MVLGVAVSGPENLFLEAQFNSGIPPDQHSHLRLHPLNALELHF
jgi:hypothetical protein